jgi:L-gulono-1,4-lactone dehydrogenase
VVAATWTNWAGNQRSTPGRWEHPGSEDELASVVTLAASNGRRVKAIGAGHSFTAAAVADDVLVQLDRYQRILAVDTVRRQVTVEAGIPLARLNEELATRGLAMANLGDIDYQTIAGAISTGTHGTGSLLAGIAGQVASMRVISGDGSIVSCSATVEPEIFHVARVGVGALGLVSAVTLDVVPSFNLRAVEEPMRLDDVVRDLDEHVNGNDHFEFFWVPHTGWALTKRNNRTGDALDPPSRFRHWRDKVLLENHAFGAVCRVGRWHPAWIPKLAKALPASGRNEYVNESYRVFASPRRVRFYEMEYEIPREACAEALTRVRRFVEEEGLTLNFPVEVRFTAPDDISLSTGFGRDNAYIAVHIFQGMEHEPYFRGVERIMDDYGGRPHWGKLHFQTAETLAPRYPEWDRFVAVRDRLDPERRFSNDYTTRVLGR